MTGPGGSGPGAGRPLPKSGLASEVLPQLREKVRQKSEAERAREPENPSSPLVEFADQVQAPTHEPQRRLAPRRTIVTFWVSGAEYGLPIENVGEIVRVHAISPVPQAPPHIRGVTNLRGRVIPVVEISTRLGGEPLELTPQSCIVAVEFEGRVLGLLVERASNVLSLSEDAIDDPPEEVLGASARYITGVGKHENTIVILLDLERLLTPENT